MQVLLVENDNLDSAESLLTELKTQGHKVGLAHSLETAVKKTLTLWPSLIVFNSTDNFMSLAEFQQAMNNLELNIPHIIIGDKQQPPSPVDNDTHLVKAFRSQNLDQIMKKAAANQKDRFLRLPGLTVDCHHGQVLHQQKSHSLTPKEFKLLRLLIEHRNKILPRKTIMQRVWQTDYMGDTRTLDVHVRWLREKIEKNPSRPQRLITVRGVGYRFVVVEEEQNAAE